MNKLALAGFAIAALVGSAVADAQGRPGGGGGGGGGAGRPGAGAPSGLGGGSPGMSGNHRGGGAAYQGGGGGYRGGYSGGGYRGGYSNSGYRGGYHGTGYRGGYRGGGYRGGYYPYWRGSYWPYWGGAVAASVYLGAPYWNSWGYPYASYAPGYYFPGAYAASPVVIEQDSTYIVQPSTSTSAASYWYYCTDPAGYYPYVQNCGKGWVPVVPQSVQPPSN